MKLKYYLKGFGVGVLFSTVILSISLMLNQQQTGLTDEQIMARARELGMEMVSAEKETDTEEPTTKTPESSTMPAESTSPDITEKETASQGETVTGMEGMEPVETLGEVPSVTESENESSEAVRVEEGTDETTVIIHIEKGMSSDTIVRLLEEAGVVESSDELLNVGD